MNKENSCCDKPGEDHWFPGFGKCVCLCHKDQEKPRNLKYFEERELEWKEEVKKKDRENQERDEWEKDFDTKFTWLNEDDEAEISSLVSPNIIKSFISNLLHKQRQELVEAVEKLETRDFGNTVFKSDVVKLLSNPKGDE